jgi:hypothetical protein
VEPFTAGVDFKFAIPQEYLINSCKNRLKYFLGIVSVYGKVEDDYILVKHVSKDLTTLGRSLGFAVLAKDGETIFLKNNLSRISVIEREEDDYFGFIVSGNNRYLLGDFTVTHNTCTAINIAEQYYDTFEKKVLVILSKTLEDNFRKQICDVTKVNQCTGTKYLDMVLNKNMLKEDALRKKVDDIIKQRYEFVGYKELAIYMENKKKLIEDQIKDPADPAKMPDIIARRQNAFAEIIRERFSNRLIIIDEAHNLRAHTEQTKKQISKAFLEMLGIVENVKLVLMTATPMYNTADEFVWMLNLLFTNDRVPTIKKSDIFDNDSNLTPKGEKLLREKCMGYISYMRGENPYSFPFRLFPSINNPKDPKLLKHQKYPAKDVYGEPIPPEKHIKFLEVVTSKMSSYQYDVYSSLKKTLKLDDDDVPEDAPEENNDVQNTSQLSNIAYPSEKLEWEKDQKVAYGSKGFKSCFTVHNKTFDYKEHVKKKYGEFLSYPFLDKYAPKIKTLIDYIKNAKGIVFIYSRYYEGGIIPLACALEHIGMVRYSVDGKNRNLMGRDITVHDQFGGKRPKYSILSARSELSPNNDLEINVAKSLKNKDGDVIKVIIVTKIGTEGIDFKRIREVHILEPWFNLNRAEQIIGRGVRTCSHVDLPKAERNVTIYFHANCCPGDEESVDLRTWRLCESKQKKIIAVENVLKETAIDCNLNKEALMFPVDKMNTKFDIVTAQGKTVKNFEVGDRDNSFICGFNKCQLTCKPEVHGKLPIDDTTFDIEFITDDIQLMKKYIASLYITDPKERTYEEILEGLKGRYKLIEEDIVNFALEEMINMKYHITLPKGDGYLIYRGNKYIFQYESLHDTMLSLEERSVLNKQTHNKRVELDISKIKKPAIAAPTVKHAAVANSGDSEKDDIYERAIMFFIQVEQFSKDDIAQGKAWLSKNKGYDIILNALNKVHEDVIAASGGGNDRVARKIREYLEKYEQAILETMIDRMTIQELFKIWRKKDITSDIERKLQAALKPLLLGDFIINPSDKKLYKANAAGQLAECNPTEYLLMKSEYETFKNQVADKPNKGKKYFTTWDKKKLVFKVREKDALKGAVCDTSPKKEFLQKALEGYLGKGVDHLIKLYHKTQFCLMLEILARTSGDFQRALYLSSK